MTSAASSQAIVTVKRTRLVHQWKCRNGDKGSAKAKRRFIVQFHYINKS